ncbi:MAG TPA: PEP-CTERM sorting domain-containing protein [Gemmatirosa sp.]
MIKHAFRHAAALAATVVAVGTLDTSAAAQQVAFSGSGVLNATLPPFFAAYGLAPGTFAFRFVLPASPAPSFANAILFNFATVTGTFTQGGTTTSETGRLTFFTGAADGGFTFKIPDATGTTLINDTGPALFNGATSSPTFVPGTYTGFAAGDVDGWAAVTTASITTTPEPGAPALLGVGLAGVAAVGKRRRWRVTFA